MTARTTTPGDKSDAFYELPVRAADPGRDEIYSAYRDFRRIWRSCILFPVDLYQTNHAISNGTT